MRYFLLQGFTTDNDIALEQLFGEHSEGTRDYASCIETIAARLSTVFASLKVQIDYLACMPVNEYEANALSI